MIKYIAALGCAFLLAGCAEKTVDELSYSERKDLADKFIDDCIAQGIDINSDEMVTCFKVEADRETLRREKSKERSEMIGLAIGAGASGYSNGYNQAASSYRRPVNCTSNTIGGYTNTSCY